MGDGWVEQADCRDTPEPERFYPSHVREERATAAGLCGLCPVRAECLMWALGHWEVGKWGVWGGTSSTERRHLRAQWLARQAA